MLSLLTSKILFGKIFVFFFLVKILFNINDLFPYLFCTHLECNISLPMDNFI